MWVAVLLYYFHDVKLCI